MVMADLLKFPDIRTLAWKSTKAQKWDTKIKRTGSGRVRTMTTWQYPQYTITTEFAVLSPEEHKRLMGFYASVKGGTIPFLWLDPEDHEEKGVRLGTGAQSEWQAVRLYGDFREPVAHIENLKLYANGTQVNAVSDKGVIRLLQVLGYLRPLLLLLITLTIGKLCSVVIIRTRPFLKTYLSLSRLNWLQ